MKYQKRKAQYLRRNQTYSEGLLWKLLRSRKLESLKFRQQHPVDNYIVDFYCAKLNLVIEIDGISHLKKKEYDEHRNAILESFGLKVLHFDDQDVQNNFWIVEKGFNEQLSKLINELSK